MRKDLRSYVTVDLDAIADNIRAVKSCVAPDVKVMAVIKTDGYGHGAVDKVNADQLGSLLLPAEHTIACDFSVESTEKKQYFVYVDSSVS